MKIIAHRANIDGPNRERENKISSIKQCIDIGYDVEIDIRMIDRKLYLGHDEGSTFISKKELFKYKDNLWIHCKNLGAISYFNQFHKDFNYFWHDRDSYTLTSHGYIWAFPGEKLSNQCICVMPELKNSINVIKSIKETDISGICTDYPSLFS